MRLLFFLNEVTTRYKLLVHYHYSYRYSYRIVNIFVYFRLFGYNNEVCKLITMEVITMSELQQSKLLLENRENRRAKRIRKQRKQES